MSKVRLGDIADIELGKMLDAEKNTGDLHPYLANVNVRWGSFDLDGLPLMRFEDDEAERFLLRPGDLVMCEGGEPGRCAIWRGEVSDARYQKALHRIRPHENVDVRWLYYWFLLQGRIGGLNQYINQTTIKHLVREDLKNVQIDLPTLDVQRRIAAVLSAIDDKIENNRKLMAELEATARLVYDEWFVRFDFPDEHGHPYRSSGGKMVWNDELKREIPAGWEAGTLADTATVTMGQSPSGTSYNEHADGEVFYQGRVDFGTQFPTARVYTTAPTRFAPAGATLLSVRAPVGDMNYAFEDCCIGRGLASVVGIDTSSSPWYVRFVLEQHSALFKRMDGNGTTFGAIDGPTLRALPVVLPPAKLLAGFGRIGNRLYGRLQSCEVESRHLQSLREWLLPMLMNGQVRVE